MKGDSVHTVHAYAYLPTPHQPPIGVQLDSDEIRSPGIGTPQVARRVSRQHDSAVITGCDALKGVVFA